MLLVHPLARGAGYRQKHFNISDKHGQQKARFSFRQNGLHVVLAGLITRPQAERKSAWITRNIFAPTALFVNLTWRSLGADTHQQCRRRAALFAASLLEIGEISSSHTFVVFARTSNAFVNELFGYIVANRTVPLRD